MGSNQRRGIVTRQLTSMYDSEALKPASSTRRDSRCDADVRGEARTVFYDCARVLAYYFFLQVETVYFFFVQVTTGYLSAAGNFL